MAAMVGVVPSHAKPSTLKSGSIDSVSATPSAFEDAAGEEQLREERERIDHEVDACRRTPFGRLRSVK